MKEKDVERQIQSFLRSKNYWVENLQSGKVLIKKGPYSHMMHLCSAGTPDLVALIGSKFVAIEVKKDKAEYDKWINIEDRYRGNGKAPPKSAQRELDQIAHKDMIVNNGGIFILTYSVQHFIGLYEQIVKE